MVSTHQRFEAVTFDYGNLDEWRSYFEEIKEIAKSCKIIEEFWNELKRKCDGLTFKDLQEEFDYSTVLLGGVTPDGEYKERSLARVYAVLFGFKPENIHDLIEKLKRDLPATTKIAVKETKFIRFVRSISDKVISILRQAESKGLIDSADVDVEVDYYSILSDYKKLIEIVENFVNNVAKILPNYNQKSLFVWTLDKLTYRYMTTAYPELRDERVFELVKDVLGLEVIFSPDVEDDKTKREYEIYSYCDGAVGKELVELFKLVYKETGKSKSEYTKTIRDYLLIVFPNLPEFAKEFYKMAKTALREIRWKFPDNILTSYSYHIQGIVLDYYSGYVYRFPEGSKPYKTYESFECNIPLLRLLDELSSGVFLLNGLLFNLRISKDCLEIESLNHSEEIIGEGIYKW
jgi:hypothetical protein